MSRKKPIRGIDEQLEALGIRMMPLGLLKSRRESGFWVLIAVGLVWLLVKSLFLPPFSLGFGAGGFAFASAFIGLEKVALRVLEAGEMRRGIAGAIFWVVFKFVVPAASIFYGVSHGFDGLGIVVGLTSGLLISAAILWARVD